jgi:hypothetical protein
MLLSNRRQRLLSNRRQRLLSNRRQRLLPNRRQIQQKTKVIIQHMTKVNTKSHTLTKSIPSNTHLIERGSQTACNRKLGYHDSCIHCKGKYTVPTHSDFITRRWLENLLSAILYTSFGIWPRDHYMPLWRLTLAHMSCLVRGFPLLGITEYPHAPFAVAKLSPFWVQ